MVYPRIMPTLEPSTEDVVIYECCVLYPVLQQKDEQAVLKEVEGTFEEVGAKQIAKDLWGRRGLAYSIKGNTEGNFVVYYYEMDPSKVKETDTALKIMKNVLRHLIVKPPKGYVIQKYSELYEKWLKERETIDQVKTREKEEKLKDQVAKRAKQQARRTDERKKTEVAEVKKPMEQADLTEKLDKLISDDTLDL